ncbi:MAG TPA: MIP/aquaporin family protein [Mycobacteriales bacterium]|nr:MIP/aquaporin family protein [Mycobacteriales bacterium]
MRVVVVEGSDAGISAGRRREPSPAADRPVLWRRLAAEALGTGLLVTAVVGSGIAAAGLSPSDVGLQLLENAAATATALAVIILLVGPVSGAHLNPVISLVDWWFGKGRAAGLTLGEVAAYAAAQVGGGIAGAVLANLMFDLPAVDWSAKQRSGSHLWLAEAVATAGLVAVVFALARSGRARLSAAAVGGYIGSAYFFTSSTSFANPAVTVARAFTDTFAGIAPGSVPPFVLAQVAGAVVGAFVVIVLYPDAGAGAGAVVVPHDAGQAAGAALDGGAAS